MRVKGTPPEVLRRLGLVKDLVSSPVLATLLDIPSEEVVSLLLEAIEGAEEGRQMSKAQLLSSALLLCDIEDEKQRAAEAEYLNETFSEYMFFSAKVQGLRNVYDSITRIPSRRRRDGFPLIMLPADGEG